MSIEITKMRLLWSQVLVQLIQKPDLVTTDSGLVFGDTAVVETDGGSWKTITDENARYYRVGTIVEVADKVFQDQPLLTKGAIIKVGKPALNTTHQYIPENEVDWTGMVLIPSGLIEAVVDIKETTDTEKNKDNE